MHQLVAGAQQVFHVENDEVIAGGSDHFAQQGRRNRIQQAIDLLAAIQPGENGGLPEHLASLR
ncbi:hypothetical protein D3C81_2151500 [compost metagenome]